MADKKYNVDESQLIINFSKNEKHDDVSTKIQKWPRNNKEANNDKC